MKQYFSTDSAGVSDSNSGFARGLWCGSKECEAKLKADTKATIRCLPLDDQDDINGVCALCGAPAKHRAIFARAY
ncbi:MAG TPA: hypothetical protein P5519_09975, partial [Spirochaetia bacterium]|nr:hypothetical protein [Spirochaetia bacterium]